MLARNNYFAEYKLKQKICEQVNKDTMKQLESIKLEAYKECSDAMYSCFALVLHDYLELDVDAIAKVLQKVDTQYMCIQEGHVTIDEIKEEVRNIVDIEFK